VRLGLALVILLAGCAASGPPEAPAQEAPADVATACIADREALLALDFEAFDQMPAGWRAVADKGQACELPAAELIAEYRARTSGRPDIGRYQDTMLSHEGQLRAANGQTERALVLFRQKLAIHVAEANGVEDTNTLRDKAEIAFLQGDRAALIAARDQLADLPMPPGMAEAIAAATARQGGAVKFQWPLNLAYTESLLKCFGRSFREATKLGCP
jgi:hypothetical protein